MASNPNDQGANPFPNNPGTIEELHKACMNVFPMYFEGAKLLINKGLSSHFQVSHTITMSSLQPSGYRFGATYVGNKMLGPHEAFPLLLADIDPSGNLNANIVHAPTDRTRLKMIAQIQAGKWQSSQFTADYKGDTHTSSLTLGNPDLISGSGVGVLHYLKTVTPKLALGAELAYQASPQLPGGHMAVMSLAGRAKIGEDASLSVTLSNGGSAHVTFYQKCSENLQIGVETETNFKLGESTATLGYQFELPKGNVMMRGSIDTGLVVRGVLEKKLSPLPFTLALCGLLHHRKNQYQFGCGLIIG